VLVPGAALTVTRAGSGSGTVTSQGNGINCGGVCTNVYASGALVNWDFELGPPNGLMRQGWNRNSLRAGQIVTISGFLSKDEPHVANARSVSLPDGRQVFTGCPSTRRPRVRGCEVRSGARCSARAARSPSRAHCVLEQTNPVPSRARGARAAATGRRARVRVRRAHESADRARRRRGGREADHGVSDRRSNAACATARA
jgi:hypothetical protein